MTKENWHEKNYIEVKITRKTYQSNVGNGNALNS